MPSTIMFKSTGLPGPSKVSHNHGTDIVITPPNEATLHITFYANRATYLGGLVTLSYQGTAWYHVAVRPGVYFARKFQHGKWENFAASTTGSFETDRKHAMEYSLDIEQILVVS